jgi:glycosyltransferase involved in cell wall biosynthesis
LSDIYLFSSKDPNQAVSGTFAYAMSCGCTVISTPIPHAVEMLAQSTGILLNKFDDSEEFKEAYYGLLKIKKNELVWARMLFAVSRNLWGNIAIHRLLFDQLTTKEENLNFCFPPIKLDHIKNLTTAFGIPILNLASHDPESHIG